MDATVFNLTEEGEGISPKPTNPPRQMARICCLCARLNLIMNTEHVIFRLVKERYFTPVCTGEADSWAAHQGAQSDPQHSDEGEGSPKQMKYLSFLCNGQSRVGVVNLYNLEIFIRLMWTGYIWNDNDNIHI